MNDATPTPLSTRVIYAVFDYFRLHRVRILVLPFALVVAAMLISGFYVVKKEERAVRVRFGKLISADIRPGLHYRIPFVEQVHLRPVMRIERQLVASREGGEVRFTILSGDTNLLEIDLILQYRIDNLKEYLYASSDPHLIVAMIARERLVDIVGQNFIDLIFTQNRYYIQRHLLEATTALLERYDVGLEIVSLDIVDVRPISETLEAFRDVNNAIAEREQAVSHANRRSEQFLARSRGQAEALLMDARAKARERVTQARSSAGAFLALLAEYRLQPETVAVTRYWQRMRTIFAEANLAAVNPGSESTINVNMLDSAAAYPPAAMAVIGEADERPLLTTVEPQGIHTVENVDADKLLLEGQFHDRRAERDHAAVATPRSLIFDSPSIFAHRHGAGRTPIARQQAAEQPLVQEDTAGAKVPQVDAKETPPEQPPPDQTAGDPGTPDTVEAKRDDAAE